MGVLESRLIIKAVDETAAAFASAEARVHALSRSVAASGGMANAAAGAAARVGATEGAIRASGTTMGAIAGAASQAAGLALTIGGAVAVHHAIKAVGARQHELVRMAVSGMSSSEIRDATATAARLAAITPNISGTETMHMLRNARSIVGTYEEAAEIMAPMMKLRTLAQLARPGVDVTEDFDQLIKGLEIKGVTQNPKQFQEYMQGIAKGINVFGDTLKPYQYYEMFKYGRQATSGLSEHFILSTAPTLAQELGGSSYGKAVSAFNAAIVGGVMKTKAVDEYYRMGLLHDEDIKTLKSGHKQILAGHNVEGWREAQADPNAWVRDYLLPALDKVGIKDRSDVMREISTLFQNQMAGQMVSLLATQQSRVDKDAALIRNAPGLEAADRALRADPSLAWEALKASIEGLTAAMLQSVQIASGMTSLAKSIAGFTSGLEAETRAQSEGSASPGVDRIRRKLNRAIFGVDTPDIDDAMAEQNAKIEDLQFGARAHKWTGRADELNQKIADATSTIASGPGSSDSVQRAFAERDAAQAELGRLREEARQGTGAWRQSLALRGEDEFAADRNAAMDMRRRGLDGLAYGGASSAKLEDFVARATQIGEGRAFGPPPPQDVSVHGDATMKVEVTVSPTSQLISAVARAEQSSITVPLNPVATGHNGRMDSDAAPGHGGVGHF